MNTVTRRVRIVFLGMALALYSAMPALADDIEIYTSLGSSAVSVKPNILFILDTSGSMGSTVMIASQPYDPNVTYSGCYGPGLYYYSSSGSVPSCWPGNAFYDYALQCDDALSEYDANGNYLGPNGPLDTVGFYTGQLAQKRSYNVWSTIWIWYSGDLARPIECAQDQGIHGSNAAPTPATYIANTWNGWQNNPTNPSVWSNGGANYTIYHWNYLNYLMDPSVNATSTRLEEMQKAIVALTDASTNINIGLMRYDRYYSQGGPVVYAMEDVNTARAAFQSVVNSFTADGATPLAETYYEALNYFGGRSVYYGNSTTPQSVAASKSSYSTYDSPIENTCQRNTIIYLTDGAPTYDDLSPSQLSSLQDFPSAYSSCALSDGGYGDADNSCLEFLAGWAANYDVAWDPTDPNHAGTQTITTYTIGFDFSSGSSTEQAAEELLIRTAAAGGGQFYEANDALSLVSVFNQIVSEILAVNTTFASPAVSVNAFNRATHLDDLYFTLFKPASRSHWDGNLKKFKIDFDSDGVPFIADVNGDNAVDDDTGFFVDTATSYWTNADEAPDGAEVTLGGAAGELTIARNVYTLGASYSSNNGINTPTNGDLTSAINELSKSNNALTDAMLNIVGKSSVVPGIPYRDTLLDWAYGIDVMDEDGDGSFDDARKIIGDPLHSEPALVQYGELSNGEPDLVSYVATNDGYLHAFDTQTGVENFAFVPQELLPLLDVNFENVGNLGKSYGLDGNVVAWVNDIDKDGEIESGENVYLYVGMRRGGQNIYSLDVTNRNSPQLRWFIEGGVGDFAELGQTWSTVNVETIEYNGSPRTVLIFGGGYDTNQDDVTVRTPDAIGRAIYIVDAETGQRLWWAGPTGSGADLELADMQYSIPARVKPLDMNGDGFIDRLYAADMGGQLWRFDLPDDNVANYVGGRIADLAEDGSINDVRRFYYPPDVALIFEEGKSPYLAILAASGYRAHPLNTDVYDRMYMIRDTDVYNVPTSYTTITEADLYDTTENVIGEGSDNQIASATSALNAANGWYITFSEETAPTYIGEKSLAEPLILGGVGIVTTYIPEDLVGVSTDSCTPREGTGSVYYVNITDGTPTYDNAGTIDLTREDRRTFLKRGGIPPSPSIIITEDGAATCIGTECGKTLEIQNVQKTYWYEKEQ